jgi:hypothetical protein
MNKIDLSGQRFGKLIIISRAANDKYHHKRWLCRCDCGVIKEMNEFPIVSGRSQSCGCIHKNLFKERILKHGMHKSPEYRAWQDMKDRCYNINNERYCDYGGRGIKVCERWLVFENFLEDMGFRPGNEFSLDRYPNNDGDYEPDNCRWGTDEQQSRNKRSNTLLRYNGEEMILSDWANKLGVPSSTLCYHLRKKSFIEIVKYYENKRGISL